MYINEYMFSKNSVISYLQEGKKLGPYISHSVQDIDTFLGFSETEDETLWSDDGSEEQNQSAVRHGRKAQDNGQLSPVMEKGIGKIHFNK